jgi:hypothetical protein
LNTQVILIVAVVIIMGWFAFGVIFNLRRGDALLKWMQKGLPNIGERTTFRWLGTSVAVLEITHARKPFRNLTTLLVLKPRDVLWMTLLSSFQGRDDLVIFRAQLTTAPLFDFECLDPKTWSGREAVKNLTGRRWETRPHQGLELWAPVGFLELAGAALDRLAAPLEKLSPRYARFSLRKDTPNFELHLPFPDYRSMDAAAWFEALRALAQAVGERE